MLSLVQAARLREDAGEVMPGVWGSWSRAGIHVRRGQLHLIASAPGVGKSAVAMTVAIKCRRPALYLSMDTDAHTMSVRVAQMVAGLTADEAIELLDDPEFRDDLLDNAAGHVQWEFRGGLEFAEVAGIVAAFAEMHGEYPHMIIVDNLSNIAFDSDEFGALRRTMQDLHELARITSAAVIVLHHVTGEFDAGEKPVPLSGLQGKVSKMPELVLTLHRSGDWLWVSPVKNRSGRADPSGMWRLRLIADLPVMQIRDV